MLLYRLFSSLRFCWFAIPAVSTQCHVDIIPKMAAIIQVVRMSTSALSGFPSLTGGAKDSPGTAWALTSFGQ